MLVFRGLNAFCQKIGSLRFRYFDEKQLFSRNKGKKNGPQLAIDNDMASGLNSLFNTNKRSQFLIAIICLCLSTPLVAKTIIFHHTHTKETMRVDALAIPSPNRINRFLRSNRDKVYTLMDPRLILYASQAACFFKKKNIEIVSAFRSREVNMMLHKKGHKVALKSRHMHGQALDFRIRGVSTKKLCKYFRKRKLGGIGCYKRSRFVHIDLGPVRHWRGH